MERRVLHLLPHPGGGGETYVDLLSGIDGFAAERHYLTAGRTKLEAIRGRAGAIRAAGEADLVHLHGDAVTAICAEALARRPGVVTLHGMHLTRRSRGPILATLTRRMRSAARRAVALICLGEAELGDAAAILGPELSEKLTVIPNGVRLQAPDPGARARVRAELGLGPNTVAAIYAGQLEERKGVLDLAGALKRARAAAPGIELVGVICGSGPLSGRMREVLAGGPDIFLGQRPDLPELLTAADIGVMPSAREGLSFAVLEMMGAGLALIVSDSAGNPDAVGEAGVTTPFGDPGALANAINELAGDPAQRERLGRAARDRVDAEFSVEAMLDATAAVYRQALDNA